MDDKEFLEDQPQDLSRREVLKFSALLGGSTFLQPLSANNTTQEKTDTALITKANILIVGGGDAGITIAARLTKALPQATVTIVEPRETHYYQPGQTLVASGVWKLEEITYETKKFIPKGVTWIKDRVQSFEPDQNSVTLSSNKKLSYDYLVVATGLSLEYQKIKGLTEQDLTQDGISSIYLPSATEQTFESIKQLAEKAKLGKVKALFTQPNTPIKCGGAPKKIMFLAENYLRDQGVRENVEITFLTPGENYFGIDPYEDAVKRQFKKRGLHIAMGHHLESIDITNKTAQFLHSYEIRGEYDKDLEEYDMIQKSEMKTLDFDFIHITPAMKAHDFVKNSPLSWQKGTNKEYGYLDVHEKSLQHKRYANVFGAGDVIGTHFGKTGGSVRKQAPVIVQNIVDALQNRPLSAQFDGYTVCPLITGYGTVMLAEFNYEGVAPSFPLDPKKERWLWWLLKVYALKPMYFYGMLKGRM
ncbi:MAG: NAD(P)/FAD-dependent oxidoreductase [Thiovulaceae bacterium]|nr:NAD(P)/FAD-dependent oxidoreductase [Sulfurimonadaceae bacterium]